MFVKKKTKDVEQNMNVKISFNMEAYDGETKRKKKEKRN